MFGTGAEYKASVLDMILEETVGAPVRPSRKYVDIGGNFVVEQERVVVPKGADNATVLGAILDNQ
jgi:hypothetical protein